MLLVDVGGKVTSVVKDQVGLLTVLERLQLLVDTPPVLLVGLSLPCENGNTCGELRRLVFVIIAIALHILGVGLNCKGRADFPKANFRLTPSQLPPQTKRSLQMLW